jgi:hypothetical protein
MSIRRRQQERRRQRDSHSLFLLGTSWIVVTTPVIVASAFLYVNVEYQSVLNQLMHASLRQHTCSHRSLTRRFVPTYQQIYTKQNDDSYAINDYEFIPLLDERRRTERPTQTSPERIRPSIIPSKPKIIVLGASGLIGRLVVRQLLEHPQLTDATIVAFVRDYDKACRVLYDDMIAVASSSSSSRYNRKGAKLMIVQGDLVPPEELPEYRIGSMEYVDKDTGLTLDDSKHNQDIATYDDEILRDVIRDCTTIISCVGTVRITNIWTDYIARPLYRILRWNVNDWCHDPTHPYYVHYRTMQKIIYYAEREQLRRQIAAIEEQTNKDSPNSVVDRSNNNHRCTKNESVAIPRIRLIRISDLCVSQPPWNLIPILINIFHSMIFRYHHMTDQLLERCKHLDTIIVRPGDIVDDERDPTTTSIQVSSLGKVLYPARISRDDTAEVVVAAALYNPNNNNVNQNDHRRYKSKIKSNTSINAVNSQSNNANDNIEPFHYTLACRWVGDQMDPYPAQGHISYGHPNAYQCLQSTIGTMRDDEGKNQSLPKQSFTTIKTTLYGICAAIPVYLVLSMMIHSIVSHCLGVGQIPCKLPRFMNSIAHPLKSIYISLITFLFGSLHYTKWIINLRSCNNVKYISF